MNNPPRDIIQAMPAAETNNADVTGRDNALPPAADAAELQVGIDLDNREQMLEIIYGDRMCQIQQSHVSGHWSDWIETNPDIMVGKPVFKRTRLTVELILENLGAGASEADLLRAYPRLVPEHIRAAMAYAADALRRPEPQTFRDSG